MYHILIVEDDRSLNQGIALALKEEEIKFRSAYDLKEAREIWQGEPVDMVLLDVNLPDGSGYDFLAEVRETSQIPVLMLTANDMEIDEVRGLNLGADDYITKPFSLMVLRARVERARKRAGRQDRSSIYEDARYRFAFDRMKFFVEDVEASLSKTEQRLLKILVSNKGQALTRERLVEILWEDVRYVDENALSVTVNRLRQKLGGKEGECPIQTIYGIGYMWGDKRK